VKQTHTHTQGREGEERRSETGTHTDREERRSETDRHTHTEERRRGEKE